MRVQKLSIDWFIKAGHHSLKQPRSRVFFDAPRDRIEDERRTGVGLDGRALDLGRIIIIINIYWCPCRLDAGHDCCSAPSPLGETASWEGRTQSPFNSPPRPARLIRSGVPAANGRCVYQQAPAHLDGDARPPRWRTSYLLLTRRGLAGRQAEPSAQTQDPAPAERGLLCLPVARCA